MVEDRCGGGSIGKGGVVEYGAVLLYPLTIPSVMGCQVAIDATHRTATDGKTNCNAAFVALQQAQ